MKRFIVALLFLSVVFTGKVWSQSVVDNFHTLQSAGAYPADFTNIMQQKTNAKDFNGFLYGMIKEGRVLYGTPLNEYVEHVADNLLRDYPQLRSELRFYILKSPVVNAYAFDEGIILVNEGLIAQVSNEAELAFVIAHEIAHYSEKHHQLLGKYSARGGGDKMSYYLNYRFRSREQEAVADRVGVDKYYSHSIYSYAVLDGLYDVLQYSDLPFDEIPFERSTVETDFYHFPDDYFLTKVAPITNRSETIDTLYTHPNISKRRAAMKLQILGKSDAGRSSFIQPVELFNEVRNMARMECIAYWLREHEFDEVVYNCHVMQKTMPDNAFLQKAMVAAYYGLSKHKNYSQSNLTVTPYKKVEGEKQQVCYFLSKLSKLETSMLALRYAWNAWEKYPEDPYYMKVIKDVMRDVVVNNKKKYTDFSDYPMGVKADSIANETVSTDLDQSGNKYEKIKQIGQVELVRPNDKFRTFNYMVVDIHRDSTFAALMNTMMVEEDNSSIMKFVNIGKKPDFKKILIVDPVCDIKKKYYSERAEKKTERVEHNLTRTLVKSAKKLKLDPIYFDAKTISKFNTNQYNDYVILKNWYREYLSSDGMEMCFFQQEEVERLSRILGCQKLCLVGYTRSDTRFMFYPKMQGLWQSVLCPYVAPAAVLQFAMPRYNTRVVMLISDFTTGEQEYASSQSYDSPMSISYLNATVYSELHKYMKGK